jgi:hypothetical protein
MNKPCAVKAGPVLFSFARIAYYGNHINWYQCVCVCVCVFVCVSVCVRACVCVNWGGGVLVVSPVI